MWKALLVLVSVGLWSEMARAARARPGTIEDYVESFVIGAVEERVQKVINPEVDCLLPSQRGHCRALILRWRYDVETGECREFKFGGCGGNANNFLSRKTCLKSCKGI